MELDTSDIERIVNAFPGHLSVYEVTTGRLKPLYYSEGIPGLSGMTADEYQGIIEQDASAIVSEADRARVSAVLENIVTSGEDAEISYRIKHSTRGTTWVHAKTRSIGTHDGNPVILCVFLDTTAEIEPHEELLDRVSAGVCVCDRDTYEMLYANRTARETWTANHDFLGQTCYSFLHGRTQPCPWCSDNNAPTVHVDEIFDEKLGRYFDFDRQNITWRGRDCFAVFSNDITESRETRNSLLDEKDQLEDIIEHIPAGVCVFKVTNGKAELVADSGHLLEVLHTSREMLANLRGNGIISRVHPEDQHEATKATKELMAGAQRTACEFRIRDDEGNWRWIHLDGTAMKRNDESLLVFGAVIDITVRKQEEARYRQTIDDLLSANPRALCAFELDLTHNVCDEGRGTSPYVQSSLAADTADGVFANLGELILDENDLARCRALFNRQGLLEMFSQGRDHCSIEYQRKAENGSTIWARTYISMIRNPLTDGIEAVIYSEDIDDRIHREKANRIATENSYDYIATIDVASGIFTFLEMGAQVPEKYHKKFDGELASSDYQDVLAYTMGSWVHPDSRDGFQHDSALSTVKSMLDVQGHYEYSIKGLGDRGVRHKRLQYAYLDESHRTVVVWQTDVTETVLKEKETAERLEVALAAAKQASNAKSVFLSRMSHEIRTPMNAIIGMDTLAIQAIGDDERVTDCLAKIGISSRYLLSLINDILDMSRIESGKMLLSNDSFLLRDLITNVDDMIFSQAEERGLDYECVVSADAVEAYIGDSMKLQQVLMNLLGNAVKFTERGKVSLSVQQVSRTGNRAKIRFIVSDTGKGISEEDQKRIFEPFEQADNTSTTVYDGTGLGLAITKSLVELMGGTLRLRSIEDVGSEFTVEVPLAIDESIVGAPKEVYHFEEMHTLIVDDDLMTCEQANQVLKDIGMISEWVTSGQEAINKVRALSEKNACFDFILIDWKMPQMDGIETTSRIRSIVGPDVTIIIISAYDWQSIEVEAKQAGANLLISKPLFKSTLVSAFQKAQSGIDKAATPSIEFDFTGKRVLLAEDNVINAEIARDLLKNKGFEVEVAENGLRALEMFTKNPTGYYDAILMDIRMPKMNGLQATSSIRDWDKPDAKTIPIIAMTANAFEEDVQKSRAAGMDAHLAKPIEPNIMYRTLYKMIEGSKE